MHSRSGPLTLSKPGAAQWSRTSIALSAAIVILIGTLAEINWLWQGTVVPWDAKNHFYPMFRFLADELARGEWPLWNPYHFAGHPSAADPQSLVFSPSMVIFALLAPHASMQLFDSVIMAHLVFGGLGMLALFYRRGWLAPGAVLAAMIFMLGGSASGRLQHTGMILSYSFFPWALFFLEMGLAKRSFLAGLAFATFAALMAQGRDQVAFLFCIWLIVAAAWKILHTEHPLAYFRSRIWLLLFMGGVGALLLAGPMLLTLQFLTQSNRPAFAFGVAAEGSLALVNWITLAIPNFFGSLDWNYDYWGPGYETIPRGDWTDRAVNYLFIGSMPTLFILWIGLIRRHVFDPCLKLTAWITLTTILFSLGRTTPIFEWIFDHVPGVALYRRPADATFALNACLAIMAGVCTNIVYHEGLPKIRPLKWSKLWFALTLISIGLVISLALAFSAQQGHLPTSLLQLLFCSFEVGAGVSLLYMGHRRQQIHIAVLVLVGLSGAELLWRNTASALNAEPVSYYAPYSQLANGEQAGLDLLRKAIAVEHDSGQFPRVEILGLSGAWMNASMVFRLENTIGYNPLRIADYERAVGPGDNSADISLRHFPENFRGYNSTLARLLGLEYLVLGKPLLKLPRHMPRPIASLFYSSDTMYIYKLRQPLPRAYFASQIKTIDSQSITEGDEIPDFNLPGEVLLDEDNVARLKNTYSATSESKGLNTKVNIRARHANSVLVEVEAEQAGILVLHDIFYPGWTARIDGDEAPVMRANILFRSVEIPAGHHLVRFEYHPFSIENLKTAAASLLHH